MLWRPAHRGRRGSGQKKPTRSWLSRASPPGSASERGKRGVQRRTRPHRRRYFGRIGQVETAGVHWFALGCDQFGVDLGLVGRECLGKLLEPGLQRCAFALRGQRLSPVECQVEMATTIVDLTDPAGRRTIELENLAVGGVERVGK